MNHINIQEELNHLIANYYNGSFAQMVCEYIRAMKMTEEEVDALLEEMKHPLLLNKVITI